MSDIKNELSNSIFNAIFDDEDLTELEDKKVIAQKLGYELSVKAIISCELDCVEQLEKENAQLKADNAELVEALEMAMDKLDSASFQLISNPNHSTWEMGQLMALMAELLQKHKEPNNA